eukprot:3659063-Amphidinium_carterae.1
MANNSALPLWVLVGAGSSDRCNLFVVALTHCLHRVPGLQSLAQSCRTRAYHSTADSTSLHWRVQTVGGHSWLFYNTVGIGCLRVSERSVASASQWCCNVTRKEQRKSGWLGSAARRSIAFVGIQHKPTLHDVNAPATADHYSGSDYPLILQKLRERKRLTY